MAIEIKVPSPGESITEVEISEWFVANGDEVEKDQEIGEMESEKATLPILATESGKIEILKDAGSTVKVGAVIALVDPAAAGKKKAQLPKTSGKETETREPKSPSHGEVTRKEPETGEEKPVQPEKAKQETGKEDKPGKIKTTPVADKMMEEYNFSVEDIIKGLKKITSREVSMVKDLRDISADRGLILAGTRDTKRKKISQLRKKLSQRLVAVKNDTAMLTTFNEADMSGIIELRRKYQSFFVEKHGLKLGYMSFFTKAATLALQIFPNVNSFLDGEEIVTPAFQDIGIAVQTEKGLMVPVIRNTEAMGLAEIEKNIFDLAGKARKNRLSIDEMQGGTFTITNGGVFGSMLSTPILNPPQSAILGMHNVLERPMAINGKVEIRPMMYLALSYDHRLIDGKESVSFLMKLKEMVENPVNMLLGGQDPEKSLLEI